MSRFRALLRWDVTVQWRQGLYFAAAFVVAIWAVLLPQLPPAAREEILPYALFMDISVIGFYFMAGVLFLEKNDGVLAALVVTPLRRGEYLLSKVVSMTLLALVASSAVVLLVHGWRLNWGLLLLGVAINAWVMILLGFWLASRYAGISDFLVPSLVYMAPSQLPALVYFGVSHAWFLYLIPTQPAMVLLEAAFRPVPAWQLLYAVSYGLLACAVVAWLAVSAYERFVVRST